MSAFNARGSWSNYRYVAQAAPNLPAAPCLGAGKYRRESGLPAWFKVSHRGHDRHRRNWFGQLALPLGAAAARLRPPLSVR